MLPDDLQYSAQHVWVRLEGATACIGITDDIPALLGPLTKIELPGAGSSIRCGDEIVVLHGATLHGVIAPLSGTITETNGSLTGEPGIVNSDPFGKGWLYKMKVEAGEEIERLREASRFLKESAADSEEPDSP